MLKSGAFSRRIAGELARRTAAGAQGPLLDVARLHGKRARAPRVVLRICELYLRGQRLCRLALGGAQCFGGPLLLRQRARLISATPRACFSVSYARNAV